ncbi:NTP transferase domain-containing protein [Pelagerythrobacter sp.]|uniref:nucleotidyltransferase family protein n=1 Tax=Pelagerythrobacter sp. TaxID=2800702 RepID=UPI0035B14CA5
MNASAPPLDRSIAFALLAAGRGSRFGGGKIDAMLGAKPVWRWAADTADAAGFATRILIVGEDDRGAGTVGDGWSIAVNPDPQAGVAGSIKLACSHAAKHRRLVIALADMPFVERKHFRALALADGVAFTRYPSGQDGVPAAFPRDDFGKLETLEGDRGAASLPWGAGRASISPRASESLIDIDTREQLEMARAMLSARPADDVSG